MGSNVTNEEFFALVLQHFGWLQMSHEFREASRRGRVGYAEITLAGAKAYIRVGFERGDWLVYCSIGLVTAGRIPRVQHPVPTNPDSIDEVGLLPILRQAGYRDFSAVGRLTSEDTGALDSAVEQISDLVARYAISMLDGDRSLLTDVAKGLVAQTYGR